MISFLFLEFSFKQAEVWLYEGKGNLLPTWLQYNKVDG